MFTGIIESLGTVELIERDTDNIHFTIRCDFTDTLILGQSIAHNGVCLTVVNILDGAYTVTAIDETLRKTDLGTWKKGDLVNLERAMKIGDRLDGHIVQGHVDKTLTCTHTSKQEGSWIFTFDLDDHDDTLIVPKGSICINGVSLTVAETKEHRFSVAIIPYTFEHTNFQNLKQGMKVNIEFDILGKYAARHMAAFKKENA